MDIVVSDNLIGVWYVKLRAPRAAPFGSNCSWCALLYNEETGTRVKAIYQFWSKERGQQIRIHEATVRADSRKLIRRARAVAQSTAEQAGTQLYEALRTEGQPLSDFERACDLIRAASQRMH